MLDRIERKLKAGGLGLVLSGVLMGLGPAGAQAPQPAAPSFEVASVKPNTSADNGWSTHTGKGESRLVNIPLKDCIEMAFGVKDYSLSGPLWLDSTRYDIVAKPPAGAPENQFNQMLQTLLVERFKLAYHREEKVLNAYALIVAKGGLKIQPAQPGNSGMSWGSAGMKGTKVSMAGIAEQLSRHLDRPVQDMTGVQGVFDYQVKWTPDEGAPALGADASERKPAADPGPSLFTALQEQLGLKLETRKLPVQILVIDRVERVPTEN